MRIVGRDEGTRILTGLATLAKGEPRSDLSSSLVDEIANHLDVVARHNHLLSSVSSTFWPVKADGDIGCAQEELRTIIVHERGVSAALFLCENLSMCNISTRITNNHVRDYLRRSGPGTC